MGANAQTSVPAFTAGQVLTAQQQTEINTGVPVFADATARNAAFGGTGEKTLAEGQLAYLEDSNIVQYYDGSNWLTLAPSAAPGLELISSTTIGTTVSSVTVSDVFSADYDNYRIMINGGTASGSNFMGIQIGNATTGYYFFTQATTYGGSGQSGGGSNAGNAGVFPVASDGFAGWIEVFSPFETKRTGYSAAGATFATGGRAEFNAGYLNNANSYTSFTIVLSSGTITGGTIRVYGYRN